MGRKLIGKVDHIVVTLATLWACIDWRLEKGEAEVQKERREVNVLKKRVIYSVVQLMFYVWDSKYFYLSFLRH